MTIIRYIGPKPKKEDNVAGTGLIWLGAGTAHEVKDPVAASRLLAHPLIWDEPSADELAATGAGNKPDPKSSVLQVAELDALRARARELGIDVPGTWRKPALTKAIEEREAALALEQKGDGTGEGGDAGGDKTDDVQT